MFIKRKKKQTSDVNFAYLSNEFPELVSPTGEGWFYAHIKGIVKFAKENPSLISASSIKKLLEKRKDFTKMWANKVKQMQVPPFALNTKGAWVLRFDDIIADALELGPLQTEETPLRQYKFQQKVVIQNSRYNFKARSFKGC